MNLFYRAATNVCFINDLLVSRFTKLLKVTSSHVLFCVTTSPKHKDIHFIIMHDQKAQNQTITSHIRRSQQIISFKRR